MNIWIDGDACPKVIKEILFRVATREGVTVTLVANQAVYVPPSPHIRALQVPKGFDRADKEIVGRVEPGDVVITADIPMAAEVIAKGGQILTPRGESYTRETIQAALTMRNFMDTLRSAGVETGGPPPLSQNDRRVFAQQLERLLARRS